MIRNASFVKEWSFENGRIKFPVKDRLYRFKCPNTGYNNLNIFTYLHDSLNPREAIAYSEHQKTVTDQCALAQLLKFVFPHERQFH